MTRLYFVDGYNFIIEDPHLSSVLDEEGLSEARRAFRDELQVFARRAGCRIRIIFDGATDPMSHDDRFDGEQVEITFTSADEKADERVVAVALEARRRGESPTIVSNDRSGVRDPLMIHGFPLITTGEFARLVREPGPPRERRAEALSETEKMQLADEFLARDAERKRLKNATSAAPDPPRASPRPVPPSYRQDASRPAIVSRSPAESVSPQTRDLTADREAKKERGKRKQERRLALIQSRRKKR